MKVQIPQHAHCEVCGRVVKFGTRLCSNECEEKHKAAVKERKKMMWILVAVIVGTLVLFQLVRLGLV